MTRSRKHRFSRKPATDPAAAVSSAQRSFLRRYRMHQRFVCISRILLLVIFLSVWEFTSSHQIIDSFIFSSPSGIARCFFSMAADRRIFRHLGTLSGRPEQPSEVGACPAPYRMARCHTHHDHRRRDVGGNLRKHSEPVYQFYDY